jgi:hypothetical protein
MLIANNLVQGWRDRFPGAGHVVEFGLNCTTGERSSLLRDEWNRIFEPHTCFAESHNQFPRLASYAVRFEADLGPSEAEQRLRLVERAWQAACSNDEDADVVGQRFCAYGADVNPATQTLDSLGALLPEFQRLACVGNLSFPGPNQDDELIEFVYPDGQPGPAEARRWRSDLSEGTITLAFAADPGLDIGEEITHLVRCLGDAKQIDSSNGLTFARWSTNVRRSGVDIGEGYLHVVGPLDQLGRCGISVGAWKYFRLEPGPSVLCLRSSSRDINCLSSFAIAASESAASADHESSWILPDRPCYQRLLALGLDFSWK